MTEISTNRGIESAAVAYVIDYEHQHGRAAHDTRGKGAPADIESDGRVIEVKAFSGSARSQDLWLERRQVEEALNNPDFHVYLVENVRQGDPALFRLIDLGDDRLARLIAKRREQHYFTIPLPVAEYDAATGEADE